MRFAILGDILTKLVVTGRLTYFISRKYISQIQHFGPLSFSFSGFPRCFSCSVILMIWGAPFPYAVQGGHGKEILNHTFYILFGCCHSDQKIPCFVDVILCDKRDHFMPKTAIFQEVLVQARQA